MKELTIVEKDRIGLLADITEILASNNINLDSISVDATRNNQAIIRILTNGFLKAKALLSHAGFKVFDSSVLVLTLEDKPGELAKISRSLADDGINILNVFVIEKTKGEVLTGLQTSNDVAAKKILAEYL